MFHADSSEVLYRLLLSWLYVVCLVLYLNNSRGTFLVLKQKCIFWATLMFTVSSLIEGVLPATYYRRSEYRKKNKKTEELWNTTQLEISTLVTA